ncbi:MAG: FecR family protein, partial [Terracidiphilus sp.]
MNLLLIRSWLAGLAALALGVVSLGPALAAQDVGQGSGQPARAVRLSYVDGQVTLAQGAQVLAQQAVANTPLFEGMQLTTADNGKAEIQFEDGSVARLSPDSSLTLKVLSGSGTSADAELLLNGGLAYFEFQGGGQAGKMSVQFGDAVATTSGFTTLRIAMDNPPGQVAVFSGNAHLEGGNGAVSVDLHGGESITLNGAKPNSYDLAESIEPDSWDAWNSDRDQALTTEAAAQTGASANMGMSENPAWNDLDANGNWYDVPGRGYIWSPYEAESAGFDPYGYGNWMWTPGYGYLWASGYPWGYLPFQCGMWNFYDDFGWGWAPGMGGCMPWWGMGFYGGPNFGHLPPGYHPIPRPISPRRPIHGGQVAMVAVNRRQIIVNSPLPARDKNTPVTIAGKTVLPLQPSPSRPVYD